MDDLLHELDYIALPSQATTPIGVPMTFRTPKLTECFSAKTRGSFCRETTSTALLHQKGMTVLMLGKYLELGLYRAEYLRSHGYHVLFPESRPEAIAIVSGGAYDIVILSYSLSDETAIELHELIGQSCPNCPVITLTEQRWHDTKIYSDKVVLVSEGPEALLEAVKSFEAEDRDTKGLRRVK